MKPVICLILLAFPVFFTNAQPGSLDKSFGTDGKTVINFGISTFPDINKAVVQSDDKIIEIGSYHSSDISSPQGFLSVRYSADGAFDYTYGDSGKKVIQFSFAEDSYARDAVIQEDGKLLLAGYGIDYDIETIYYGIIIRMKTDGTLDSTFGEKGIVQPKVNGSYSAIAVQADSKIIAVGGATSSTIVNRFLENGVLDSTFGSNGFVYASRYFAFLTCKIQPDKKIVMAGYNNQLTAKRFCLQRYMPDGAIDESFGNKGTVITDYGDDALIHDMALQPDGKIVVTGQTSVDDASYPLSFATARYNADGSLDSDFGIDGKVTTSLENKDCIAKSVLILKDNKILIGGSHSELKSDFIMVRLNTNGTTDSSFGENGMVFTNFGSPGFLSSVLLQSTGKIVAAGISGDGNDNDENDGASCALARYFNDAPPPIPITRIKRWLHKHGFTWEDCPPSVCDNISGYAVQRSSNGVNWTTVFSGRRSANSRQPTANSYVDPSPLPGTNYYRLQTTSVDGAVANSNVIAISGQQPAISLSPNPARNILRIEGLSSNQKTKITVVDLGGNVACSLQLSANSSSYNLNISTLKPGNYLLRIETAGNVITKQFVKE